MGTLERDTALAWVSLVNDVVHSGSVDSYCPVLLIPRPPPLTALHQLAQPRPLLPVHRLSCPQVELELSLASHAKAVAELQQQLAEARAQAEQAAQVGCHGVCCACTCVSARVWNMCGRRRAVEAAQGGGNSVSGQEGGLRGGRGTGLHGAGVEVGAVAVQGTGDSAALRWAVAT